SSAVALSVEGQGVGAIWQRRARVRDELRKICPPVPALGGVDRDRLCHDRLGGSKARRRVDAFGARHRWTIAVSYRDRHAVRAGWQRDELLEDDALIVAQRLLEIAHADLLVAADLPHRDDAAVCKESRFHTIRTRQQRKRPRRAAPRVASLAEPQIRTLVSRELPMANENLAGRSIAGYRLLERVGEGGTAEVYRAEHAERGACAFKVLRQRLRGDPTVVKRFLREAGYGSRVKHPGVVRTYDFGEADGLYYLALEWAKGEPLADFLHRNGPLAPADAVALARQLADALTAAHQAGIIHRDLK